MSKRVIYTSNAPEPIGPYSQAIIAGQMLYVSGQIPIVPSTGNIIEGEVKEQTEQVMKNISAILTAAGSGFDQVVKTSIFIKDMNTFSQINEVYGTFFDADNAPARETVEVARLPKDVLVEISCIAYLA
jgi:2-iminobutanoate/2-iminopropanoate deaminase